MDMPTLEGSLKSLYDKETSERQPYIDRALQCAKVTIPALFPDTSDTSSTTYATPYQSLGSRGLNNLSSKLLLSLFPPNGTFFRISPSEDILAELADQQEKIQEVEEVMMKIEKRIMNYIDTSQIKVTLSETLKQVVLSGNALLFLPPDRIGIKMYKLHNYIIKRDPLGTPIRTITVDKVAYSALPEETRNNIVLANNREPKPDDILEIYTVIYLDGETYYSYQEVEDILVKGTEQQFPKDKVPYIPVRFFKEDGQSYGRSFCEEYLGDLKSVEALEKAIVEFSAIASAVFFMVNPNAMTNLDKLTNAQTGDFIVGRRDDIQPLQLDKYADLQVSLSKSTEIQQRLSYAFLLNSAVQRNGERVTAEEIRYVARELEDTLGGVYSLLSQELQLPLIRVLINQLSARGVLPDLPEGTIDFSITTGMEALGRGYDLQKIDTFLMYLQKLPPEIQQRVKPEGILLAITNALSLDREPLIKSDVEIQQEMQQQQQMALEQQVAPQVASNMGEM